MSNQRETIKCPKCGNSAATEKTVGLGDSVMINCPKCRQQSTLGECRLAATFDNLTEDLPNGDPVEAEPPPVQAPPPAGDDLFGTRYPHRVRRRGERGIVGAFTYLIDFLDFRFRRFLTPFILRLTWAVAVLLLTLSLILNATGGLAGVASGLIGDVAGASSNNGFRGFNPQSYRGGRSAPSSNWEFDPPESAKIAAKSGGRAFTAAIVFCIQLLVVILTLLWVRVLLEAVMVVFQIASDVKAIRARGTL